MPTFESTPEHKALHDAALAILCPRCGAKPRIPCQGYHGRFMVGLHAERLAAAEGLPSKENREHSGRRTYLQGRADPELRVRRDDEAA